MRIFITGVTGYLGRRLASHLTGLGYEVHGSGRRVTSSEDLHVTQMSFGEPVHPATFRGHDLVIHAAHDLEPGAMERNIEGTRAWQIAARLAGVPRQIFVSSYSARAETQSEYGKTKYRIERLFLDSGDTVLRPGLVVGRGGLFERQRAALLRTFVVPVIGAGTAPTAIIGIRHFLEAVECIVARGAPGEYGLFYDHHPAMREFIRAVKAQAGQRVFFFPMPARLAIALIRLGRALGLRVPADPDQIRALEKNQDAPWRSDLPALLSGREAEFNLDWALAQLSAGL